MPFYKDKKILITGGTGSYGWELTVHLLLKSPSEVRIFSRGENGQVEMEREFSNPRLRFYIGDVRDRERLMEAMEGVDIVFHFAALKHVPVGEKNVWEFVRTNVEGTRNVIEAAKASGVERAILISSDKAVEPINIYGYTKAIAERMFVTADSSTKFICIRSGNLTGSHGSVVPLFYEQVKKGEKVTLTDERMTRFLEMPDELASFVLEKAEEGKGGEVFVPKMDAVNMTTLAKVMAGDRVEIIGIRPGEKLHEVLCSREEAEKLGIKDYSSEFAPKLSEEELRNKLKSLGYL